MQTVAILRAAEHIESSSAEIGQRSLIVPPRQVSSEGVTVVQNSIAGLNEKVIPATPNDSPYSSTETFRLELLFRPLAQ